MIITDIDEISKSKVKVSTDIGATFSLYKSELRTYGIAKDKEFSKEDYDSLVEDVLVKRAKLRCMNLLKSRDYTRYQMENKLKSGYYPDEVIDRAIAYVMSYGYIDDVRYAATYLGCKSATKSKKQIRNELMLKGISSEDIETAFGTCMEENRLTDEAELIEKLIKKKKFDKANATYEEKQKIIGFLYRKGFALDIIYKAIE
jgi:regulatory protein